MDQPLIEIWRELICGMHDTCVLFKYGTCVIGNHPETDPVARAKSLLRQFGPIIGEGPSSDYAVYESPAGPGWLVTSPDDNLMTHVGPEEVGYEATEEQVGRFGRAKRARDAEELVVIHVQTK